MLDRYVFGGPVIITSSRLVFGSLWGDVFFSRICDSSMLGTRSKKYYNLPNGSE